MIHDELLKPTELLCLQCDFAHGGTGLVLQSEETEWGRLQIVTLQSRPQILFFASSLFGTVLDLVSASRQFIELIWDWSLFGVDQIGIDPNWFILFVFLWGNTRE